MVSGERGCVGVVGRVWVRVLGQKKLANFFMIWKSCFWFTEFQHLVSVMRGRVLWRCRDRDGCGEAEDALGSLESLEEGEEREWRKTESVLVFVFGININLNFIINQLT